MKTVLTKACTVALPAIAGAAVLGLTGSATQAQGSGQPQPGYWEYSTRVLGVGETEQKCVRQSEINRFFGGLSTRRWQCTYPVRQVGGGQARFEGTCRDRRGRTVQVRLRGPYDSASFRFSGGAQLTRGTPFIPASINARRISAECPAGAEYF